MTFAAALDSRSGALYGARARSRLSAAAPLFLLCAIALPASAQIQVQSATYGGNANPALHGNATAQVVAACNGKMSCQYTTWWYTWGDVVPGKAKDFVAQWTCAGDPTPHSTTAAAEAGYGSLVSLACSAVPPTPVPTVAPTPSGTPAPWPTPDPAKTVIHVYCLTGEPGCLPGGVRWFWQFDPRLHVLVVTPTP